MTQEQVKQEWGKLLAELHAALSGEQDHPRAIPAILRDVERLRLDPAAKGLCLVRPCSWLAEWAYIPLAGKVTELERERRQWVDGGWLPATDFDKHRHKMQAEAEKARQEFEATRQAKYRSEAEEFAAQNRPITRKSLELAAEAVLDKVW